MPRAIVLGAGLVGSVMACDLAADDAFEVAIADVRPEALAAAARRIESAAATGPGTASRGAYGRGRAIRTIEADLADPAALRRTIEPFDIVLGALPSRIGLQSLRAVIEAGRNYCDICFMPEDALDLDAFARSHGVTAIVDCGVAPGMSNMIAGHAAACLQPCESIEILVGGLPRERRWPFQYKAGFSPHDVIEEYTRPSRIVEHGRVVVREALSEPELVDLPGVGTVEAFNTDGLRSLARTLRVPFMKEKTLRYPGHIELMRVFRATGLFSREPVEIPDARGGRASIRPIDVISALMFPMWTYQPGEEDLTVMRISATGVDRGERVRLQWDLLDVFDSAAGATSMSRTTAFPCTILARFLARGELSRPGVVPPELLGAQPGLLDRVLRELASRGVRFTFSRQATPPAGG
jgi:saccharopine dehydrogenase-like NADP-dependent oxidoreductase